MFAYDMRHGDDGDPVTIEKYVLVNHYATAILNRPIAMTRGDYRPLIPDDINYPGDEDCTLKDYMAKHPPQKKEHER